MGERTTTPSGLSASEELLARTFDHWREEFRSILESHRREIQDRLEKIEREIEKKSDKENVEVIGVVMTSSPTPTPAAIQATCKAAVPLEMHTAYFAPV